MLTYVITNPPPPFLLSANDPFGGPAPMPNRDTVVKTLVFAGRFKPRPAAVTSTYSSLVPKFTLPHHHTISTCHFATLPFRADGDVAQIKAVGINTRFRAAPPQVGGGHALDNFTDTGISGGAGSTQERPLEVRARWRLRGNPQFLVS
jgi:hypothetical protein